MAHTYTDCRSEEGVTVGLIDALISVARVLAKRDLSPAEVGQALSDLRNDEDLTLIFKQTQNIQHRHAH